MIQDSQKFKIKFIQEIRKKDYFYENYLKSLVKKQNIGIKCSIISQVILNSSNSDKNPTLLMSVSLIY